MKKLLVIILVLIALVAGRFLWQDKNPADNTIEDANVEEVLDEETNEDEIVIDTTRPEPIVLDEDGEPIAEDMEAINAEILQRLEAQAEIGLTGDELTDEDIKLIQDILDAITSSVEGQ